MQRLRTPLSVTLTVLGLMVVANPTRASAQDEGDFAAYFALNFTPLGAFVPLPPPASAVRGSAFVFRYGNLDFGSGADGSLHNFALAGDFSTGRGRFGLTLGGTTCDGCDGNIMRGWTTRRRSHKTWYRSRCARRSDSRSRWRVTARR